MTFPIYSVEDLGCFPSHVRIVSGNVLEGSIIAVIKYPSRSLVSTVILATIIFVPAIWIISANYSINFCS